MGCGNSNNKPIPIVESEKSESIDDGNFFNNIVDKNINEDTEANQFLIRQKRKQTELRPNSGLENLFAEPVLEKKENKAGNSESDSESSINSDDSEEKPKEKEIIVRSKQFKRPS